ncbi:NAD(P)-dependent alcohol dehydrogenase [Balneola sp. MJW-20]|uniref:NAD(P)-dependent alcohol dehydrogenase n=1 Tax=Gracilimonas aurantiaca TaxID=3234185 RepID=UPI003467AEFA
MDNKFLVIPYSPFSIVMQLLEGSFDKRALEQNYGACMKAAILTGYGGADKIEIRDLEKPAIGDNEILIRTAATTVTQVDNIFRSGDHLFARMATGVIKPKISVMGTELAGWVESVGKDITGFKPGEAVIADSGTNYGAHAEYVKITPEDPVTLKPENMSFPEAAALSYGGLTALSFLQDTAKLQAGQRMLILGASGSVGSFAVQIAKAIGAHVTAVASGDNAKLVLSLGADEFVDYRNTDITQLKDTFDVIFDSVGKYRFGRLKPLLNDNGIFMTTDLSPNILWNMILTGMVGNKKAKIAFTGLNTFGQKMEGLQKLLQFYEDGKLKPVIDRTFTLDEIRKAHEYVSTGRKKGNVVVTVSEEGRV